MAKNFVTDHPRLIVAWLWVTTGISVLSFLLVAFMIVTHGEFVRGVSSPSFMLINSGESGIAWIDESFATDGTIHVRQSDGTVVARKIKWE